MAVRLLKLDYLKLTRLLFVVVVLSVIAFFIYLPNYTKIKKLREKNAQLKTQIHDLKQETEKLQQDIEKVESDSFIWENLARKNIGAVRNGEIVIDIREQEE